MATLNIKNVPEKLYSRLKARARRERRSISQEVLRILEEVTRPSETVSILELRGLGKGIWKGIDPAVHVDEERGSWD
ncbi:MAG: FitA-like ribbon-helix-helix domain-containing protein [Vicinamibacteria bacterium]